MGDITHKLGFASGRLIEHEDGTVSYRLAIFDEFRVRISDVTGFSASTDKKNPVNVNLRILGNGTELATAKVGHGVSEKIEAWFRAHPDYGRGASAGAHEVAASFSVADELVKLASLRDQGVISEDEFAAQKARLLGG